MAKNIDDIIKEMPQARRKKVINLSQKKVEEMLAHAATLTDFRKAVGKTQAEVAKHLGIKQNAVSQLEKRSDTYVSTLRRFLKSLDMKLELSVVAKDGTRIDLPNFLSEQDANMAGSLVNAPAKVRAARAVRGKASLVAPKLAKSTKATKPRTAAPKPMPVAARKNVGAVRKASTASQKARA